MAKKIVKYNPAFLSDKDLIDSFVVRHTDLELVLQPIRENTTQSNQHMMIIGPRGIGKTTLALRAVAEVRKDEKLSDKWYPLVFAEESYQVTSAGEFWLEALFHLGQQEKRSKWHETYKELQDESNEDRLADRALTQLLDFADSQKKRLLLVVENFNMLLGAQIDDDDAWKMRKVLLHEPRIMLLATATTRFEQMDNPGKAMFELFRPLTLKPLDNSECREIWKSVTGKDLSEERTRPLQILTGGNPRLMTIISSFGKDMSFNKLMNELTRLVDDHTEYFKSHLDGLPPIERKAYLALAELWDPSLAKEVAKLARLNVSKTSALLGRLKEKGAVVVTEQKGRKKWYQVAERMYNIYYLMRRRGAASARIKAVVRFMVHFYGRDDLVRAANRIAEEACKLTESLRKDHYLAYEAIFDNVSEPSFRKRLLKETPVAFFKMTDAPNSIQSLNEKKEFLETIANEKQISDMIEDALKLTGTENGMKKARKLYQEVIKLNPSTSFSWCGMASLLQELKQYDEAEKACHRAIELYPKTSMPWGVLGNIFSELGRNKEAEAAYNEAINVNPEDIIGWFLLAMLLHDTLDRYQEAEVAYRKAVELDTKDAFVWFKFGKLLHEKLSNYEEARTAYQKAVDLDPQNSNAWLGLGDLLEEHFDLYEEAKSAYQKAIELEPKMGIGWILLASVLDQHLGCYKEAREAYLKALALNSDIPETWFLFGNLLNYRLQCYEEAGKAYKKGLDIEPTSDFGWFVFGELLHRKLNSYKDAEEAYRKAISLNIDIPDATTNLISLLLDKLNKPIKALELAESCLRQFPNDADVLNGIAWYFFKYGKAKYFDQAESWICKAIKIEPNDGLLQHTLASILCAMDKVSESLESAKIYLSDRKAVKESVEDAIDLFVSLAASGHAQQALEILSNSPSADILEPLIVGLRLFIGQDVSAAAEILEVGKDVAKKIEERQAEKNK